MSIITGTSGNDTISGGNGVDTIYGGGGNDILSGGNGVDTLYGEDGNDQLSGDNGSDALSGGAGDDLIDGLNGFDTAYYSGPIDEYQFLSAAGYLHIIHLGGAGADGHDRVKNVERLVFADRVIDIGSGKNKPVAVDDHVSVNEDTGTYSSGAASVKDNDFDFDGDPLTVSGGTFTGTYGTLTLNSNGTYSYTLFASAQALAQGENVTDSFNYTLTDNDGSDTGTLVFHIAGLNDAPTANPDTDTTDENAAILIDVLANDTDVDHGALLTVIAASVPPGQGSVSVVSNQVQFDPGTDFDSLAVGESVDVVVGYDMEDEHGAAASSSVTITVTGSNDGPVANPDTDTTDENAAILVDVLANDTDADNGAVLTVIAASAPSGQGSASVVSNQVEFDPGTDFDSLAVGESVDVVVTYDIEDEYGAAASSALTITVTGSNDGPVANPDATTAGENEIVLIDVLANDTDVDNNAILTVIAASAPAGQGTASVVGNQVQFDPGTDFDYLAEGETADVVVDYTIEDEYGAQSASTVTITVQGEDDPGLVIVGTPGDDNLTGTAGDDIITALGGDDNVSGLGGADLIDGGDGSDFVSGDAGDDVITGGNDEDVLTGGDGSDQLSGQAGNDSVVGGNGNDQLSGGDGFDSMFGEAGNDVLAGGNDGDLLSGGDGNDQLSGEAGNDVVFGDAGDDQLSGGAGDDSLDGGDGDDALDGGDGQDSLSGGLGTNVLNGGLGNDEIIADSTDGAQTIDGGDGDDTIVHYYRSSASTITTGLGSDTIELAYAGIGGAAITVTDFTTGAGGDMFRLEGVDGALLDQLSGWDGSSNPFGSSGFLRLQQSGSDTVLQWDQDGTAGGANWETLVVFQNTIVGNFTGANFVPTYPPDGSAPAGQTITGTNNSETLVGTIGDDTINALGGNDNVSGRAGADQIDGGDGADVLNGEGGNDIIAGGNDGDQLSGGDGQDQLSGQTGNDSLFGENGDDQLSGGDGQDNLSGEAGNDVIAGGNDDDFLSGGEGADSLDGGDGADVLSDFIGANSFVGGAGNDQITAGSSDGAQTIDGGDGDDTIVHYYRTSASTITTGSGSDTIELAYAGIGAAAITVTDFTTGGGGDMFRLNGADGALLDQLSGWDGSSNPFGSGGFLRLQQSGSDTVLQWDQDGTAGGANWETLVVFQNTTVGDFTDANFVPGYDPDGTVPAGETINGTAGDDFLEGTVGGDTINAFAGADSAFGLAGNDFIYGGDGVDNLYGNEDDDYIDGGNDDDQLVGGDGNDQLLGQAGSDILYGENGDDQLSGGDGLDNLTGEAGNDIMAGGNDDDVLSGGEGIDSLDGGGGNDILTGGSDGDVLTGGAGADTFAFDSPADGPDEITDFVSGSDVIQIFAGSFGGGLTPGGPVSLVSGSDPTASNASGQFLFDTDDGRLFWDADGTGSDAAVLIATLSNIPTLTTSDFVVI